MEVYVDDEAGLRLDGLKQHYIKLTDAEKNRKLFDLLDVIEFNQVVIFVSATARCKALTKLLTDQNFPAISIHGALKQPERCVLLGRAGVSADGFASVPQKDFVRSLATD